MDVYFDCSQRSLTPISLEAGSSGRAGFSVVHGFTSVAVSGLRVPAKIYQQVDEVGRFATRRVVKRRFLRLGRIHVGP